MYGKEGRGRGQVTGCWCATRQHMGQADKLRCGMGWQEDAIDLAYGTRSPARRVIQFDLMAAQLAAQRCGTAIIDAALHVRTMQ